MSVNKSTRLSNCIPRLSPCLTARSFLMISLNDITFIILISYTYDLFYTCHLRLETGILCLSKLYLPYLHVRRLETIRDMRLEIRISDERTVRVLHG